MDLLPGASLELRIYVILGIIGVMFFGAILALAVGRFISIKSSAQIDTLTDDTVFGKQPKAKKIKEDKPLKSAKKSKTETLEDLIVTDEPVGKPRKEKKEKADRHFFGKKKVEAVQLLAAPSGYEEEYAPTATRDFNSDVPEVVEYVEETDFGVNDVADGPGLSEYVEESISHQNSDNNSYDDLDTWVEDDAQESDSKEEDKKSKNNSPFGGADDWEF